METRRRYPIFLSLDGFTCLVVGGGGVGERKVRGLLESGARVRIVSRELTPWLEEMRDRGAISHVGSTYTPEHLEGVMLAFAATNDPALNLRIAGDARHRAVLCNMATDPECGSFIVPSSFSRGPLTVAVSTSGVSPALARKVRRDLERQFGLEWEILLRFLGLVRQAVQSRSNDSAENQMIFRTLVDLPLLRWIRDNDVQTALEKTAEACGPHLSRQEAAALWDEAWKASS